MTLQEYIRCLKACIASHPPEFENEDSVLGLLYEAHSESSALYDDKIKSDFHALYEAMHGIPPCGRWIRSFIRSVRCAGIIRSLDLLKAYASASCCMMSSREALMLPYRIADICPKSGVLTEVHLSILHQRCQILPLELGQRGWVLVDIGDTEFGLQRISISHIASICEEHENNEIRIETENSIYLLVKEE